MTKFGDRILNFNKKKQPDNGKQGGMAKHSESLPEHQKKQMEWSNEEGGVEIERHLEQLPETVRLNEIVHAVERRIGRFNAALRAGILAAAMAAGGAAASERVESQPEQERSYTHEEYIKENEERSIAVLSKFFKDAPQVLKACGGVTDFQKNLEDENAPVLMHIAQNHGALTYLPPNPSMYVSQSYISECIIAMIQGNNTGKVLPIGLELVSSAMDREGKMRELMSTSLYMSSFFRGHGQYFFGVPNIFNTEFLDRFPYKIPHNELSDLAQPLLAVIERFEPEAAKEILSEEYVKVIKTPIPGVAQFIFYEGMAELAASQLMELLHKIEAEYNVHFEITDASLNARLNTNMRAGFPLKSMQKYLQSRDEEDLSRLSLETAEYYNIMHLKRDQSAVDATISLGERFDTKFAVCVFGSAHDFGDDAVRAGVNMLRVETDPMKVHSGIVDYDQSNNADFDMREFRYNNISPTAEMMQRWVTEQGGREMAKRFIKDGRQYHFLFRNISEIQKVLQFNSDELFSIVRDSIVDNKHSWAHGIYGDIEKFEDYLSAEQFTSLKRMISECEKHTRNSKKREEYTRNRW